MPTTEGLSRLQRNQRRSAQAMIGRSTQEAVYGAFTWDAKAVAELTSRPSIIVIGQTSTSQGDDGTFPWMAEVDGIDEAGLG